MKRFASCCDTAILSGLKQTILSDLPLVLRPILSQPEVSIDDTDTDQIVSHALAQSHPQLGRTPLHLACLSGSGEEVDLLLHRGSLYRVAEKLLTSICAEASAAASGCAPEVISAYRPPPIWH
jgi:hypothetical protein